MFDLLVLGFALCFSVLLPFAILSLRQTVRSRRLSAILDLQRILNTKEQAALGKAAFSPRQNKPFRCLIEFEAVKSRFLHELDQAYSAGNTSKSERFRFVLAYALCSTPLVILTFSFSTLAISIIISTVLSRDTVNLLPNFSYLIPPPLQAGEKAILWVFVVAFLGGYLFAVRGLLRAVNNFDLSPGSFLSAALQLLLGVVTAVLIVVAGVNKAVGRTLGLEAAASASILAAFVIGFVPELGIRTLYRMARLRQFKRENQDVYRSFRATPVEVVDGIDTEVRNRLADLNIFSVQNLATANPVMLFVETPFHIGQSIDWVAQAQLFAAVGPEAVLRLWDIQIRTIFDLEQAVLEPGYTTPRLKRAVGQALRADPAKGKSAQSEPPEEPLDEASVEALVRNMLDDLHVHRLRQVKEVFEEHLGVERKRRSPAGPNAPIARSAPGDASSAANDTCATRGTTQVPNGADEHVRKHGADQI